MKKIASLLLCLMLLLAMAAVVCAEETGNSETQGDTTVTEHTCSFQLSSDTATCNAVGIKTYICTCGETKTEDSPLKDHSYGALTKVDNTNHVQICSGCGLENATAHSWNSGEETEKATCVKDGLKTFTCTGCAATKTETVSKTGVHDWNNGDPAKHTCKNCTAEGTHSIKEEITQKPTCKDTGVKTKSCTACGYAVSESVAKLDTHTYDSACDPECNVCEKEREIQHSFTTVWSKDYNGHWHECTKCGEKKDFAKHVPGPAATEDKDQVCLTCGYIVTAKKEHKHTYEKEWTSDEAGHWHSCTKKTCTSEQDYEKHVFEAECDISCSICGYERDSAHTYDGWKTSDKDHWQECTVCGELTKKEKHVPGTEATDEAAQLCTICEYELAPMLEHTHDFGEEWVQAQDSHWQQCKCGELSVPEAHIWDEGRENRDDTVTYTCLSCGMEKTEEAPSSGFPWLLFFLIILAVLCIAGIVALVVILKRGGFEDDEEDEEQDQDEEEFEEDPEEDEEKMIDDYFASLGEDGYR